MILNVTCTAMPRPKIHDQCFRSYTENITGVNWKQSTLYMNIDPLPCVTQKEWDAMQIKRIESVSIAKKYFGNVEVKLPENPNYTRAYNWVYSNAKTEYILNLEDDWALIRKVDIKALIKPFEETRTLYEVVLRAYTYHYPCTCTSPAILHRRYYGVVGGRLNPERNPETQTHSRRDLGIFIPNKKNCPGDAIKQYVRVWPEECNNPSAVVSVDIGREWLDRSPYMRPQMLDASDPRYTKKDQFRSWIIRRGWDTNKIVKFIEGC